MSGDPHGNGEVTATPTMAAVAGVASTTVNTSLQNTEVGGMATRAAFLSLFIITGFVGNSVLIATIVQNSRLRTTTINRCILSLAIASLLDASVNMPLILGATITEKWDYSETACKVNAFGIQLMSIVVCVGLMTLTLERFLAVMDPLRKHRRLTILKISLIIGFVWLHGIAFSFPLLLDSIVPIQVFSARYLCTISNDAPLLYLCLTSICAYLIPVLLTLGFFIYIIQKGVKQNREDKKRQMVEGHHHATNVPPHKMWAEIEGARYTGVLFVLWCVLQGPYLIISSIMWYKNSEELSDNEKVGTILHFEYPWELELALTWLKLSYPGFLPIVTLLWKKDVWKKMRNKMCKKSNLVVDSSGHSSPDHQTGVNGFPPDSNGVPVLYATEDGLHVKTYGDEDAGSDDSKPEFRDSNTAKVVTSTKCDVLGSRNLLQIDEDTSDYDSSGDIDPFSTSNPISVRTEYGRQRSVSTHSRSSLSKRKTKSGEESQQNGSIRVKPTKDHTEETEVVEIGEKEHRKKKKKRNNVSNESRDIDEAEMGEINHGAVFEVCQEDDQLKHQTEVSLERTSQDSGMGSMEKERKATRARKKKKSDEVVSVEEYKLEEEPQVTDDRSSCWVEEIQQIYEVPTDIPKRKRKKKPPTSNQNETPNDIEETPSETASCDDQKPPIKLQPLPRPRDSLKDTFSKGPKLPDLSPPEVPPRNFKQGDNKVKANTDKPKKPSVEKRARPQSDSATRHDNCECGQHSEEDCTVERPGRRPHSVIAEVHQMEVRDTDLEPPRPLPKPKKRKKKKRIGESPTKTPAEELDEEIQGVLY